MAKYFSYFPKVKYKIGEKPYLIRNISRRIKIRETLNSKPYIFLPYTVVADDRPEDVAFYYYGTVDMTWLVWLANDIVDPYIDWPMNQTQFSRYLEKKYAEKSGKTGFEIINWTQNTNITENIVHYKNEDGNLISPDTYQLGNLDGNFEAGDWTPVRIYDHEFALNDEKREIELINKEYASQIVSEFRGLLNE